MGPPGGSLVSITPLGGAAFAFPAYRTGRPIVTPTDNRQWGISLNDYLPVNRDGAVAKLTKLRLTWKILALSDDPVDPYADVMAQLGALWDLYFTEQRVAVVAYASTEANGALVGFPAILVPGALQLVPYQIRHNVPEISLDVVGAFTPG